MFVSFVTAIAISLAPIATAPEAPAKAPTNNQIAHGYHHPDMQGYQKSAYKGKYYKVAPNEHMRKCIIMRESRARYGAKPWSSGGQGAYQFTGPWRDSLVFMMAKEIRNTYGKKAGNRIIKYLRTKPIYNWSRLFQDWSYYRVMNNSGPNSGWHHWQPVVPNTYCGP